uniref:Homeodomain mating type HD2-1 protein n=1 Tax=Limonomyces culmigenus TaxID=228944 RepID=A0A0P0JYT2_9AGAM|nr:homeodomain mating type HD2-1 protein [Limonomyces culmigenus]
MHGFLQRAGAGAIRIKAVSAEFLHLKGLPLPDAVSVLDANLCPPALELPSPPSIVHDLFMISTSREMVKELSDNFDTAAQGIRSTWQNKYRSLTSDLDSMPLADVSAPTNLYRMIQSTYNQQISRLKENHLRIARSIPDSDASKATPFNEFQNKRARTRKIGLNAAGYAVYDREEVPRLEDVVDLSQPNPTGIDTFSEESDTDVSEVLYETVYESTSDDACDLLVEPLPRRREHVFDSPVPAFVYPVKYPPPRKLVAAEKFKTIWPRNKPHFPRMRVAHMTVDQLADEFAQLSVKPRLVRACVPVTDVANLKSLLRRHPPTARPDRRSATMSYMNLPSDAPMESFLPAPCTPRPACRLRLKPAAVTAAVEAPIDFALASPASLVCPSTETPTGNRKFPKLRTRDTSFWKAYRDVDVFALTPASSFSRTTGTPSRTVTTPVSQPTAAPAPSRKRSREEEPAAVVPAPAKKSRTAPKPSLPHRRPTHAPVNTDRVRVRPTVPSAPAHAPVNTDRVRVRPAAPPAPVMRTPTRRERTASWVSSQPRTPSSASTASTPSVATPSSHYGSLDPSVYDDDAPFPAYEPTDTYRKMHTDVPVYPPAVFI